MNKEQKMLAHIVEMAGAVLSLDKQDIAPDVPIQNLGFTSVELVKFVDKISEAIAEEIHPGVFFEYSTLSAFTDYLLIHKAQAIDAYLMGISDTADSPSPTVASKAPSRESDGEAVFTDADWAALERGVLADVASAPSPDAADQRPSGELPQGVPVIIGGGIAGMLISRKLSQKDIPHVIIGRPMLGDSPKLGESMTELVSIDFAEEFKDYACYFYAKEVSPFYMGDRVAGLRFDYFKSLYSLFREGTDEEVSRFIHIDRIGFDRALYKEVSQSEHCYWIEAMVGDIEYDQESDKILSIDVEGHGKIVPSFVWDCTNYVRLLGKKLKIPFRNFDAERQVFFTHYLSKDGGTSCHVDDVPWLHATSLLQAEGSFDGLHGISWLIPLGSYVSVGISMAAEDVGDKTPEEVITLLTRAYRNRGVDYSLYFPRRKEILHVPSQHFTYDRFVGKNWSLVGGSAISAWFTSGSNISIIVCMAAMADKIMEHPEVYGAHYTRHVRGFMTTQQVYDTLLESDLGAVDAMKFLSGIIEQSRKRIASFYMFRKGLGSGTAELGEALWEEEVLIDKTYFNFLKQIATHATPAKRSEQARAIFGSFSQMQLDNKGVRLPYLRGHAIRDKKPTLFSGSLTTAE